MGLSVQAKTAARPERSGLVITEAAGLTSCSVSAGYCFPPHRGSALIASLMSSGSLFISGCVLSPARLVCIAVAAAEEEVVAFVCCACAEEHSGPLC